MLSGRLIFGSNAQNRLLNRWMFDRIRQMSTKCGVLRYVPSTKRYEIIADLDSYQTIETLHELNYGIYSDILLDINDVDNSGSIFKSLLTKYSYSNSDGTHLEILPRHIEKVIKTNFTVRKLYQLEHMMPEVEILFSNPVSTSKYHVRLKNMEDFKLVRQLEKRLVIPDMNYRPAVSLTYFDHGRLSKLSYNMIALKLSNFSIGAGMNCVDWLNFSLTYGVRVLKKSSTITTVEVKSEDAYNRLMCLDQKSPRTPFIASPFAISSNLLNMGSYYAKTDYYMVSYPKSLSNDSDYSNMSTKTNKLVSALAPNNIAVLGTGEDNSKNIKRAMSTIKYMDYMSGVPFNAFYKGLPESNNMHYGVNPTYFPIRSHITNNIIKILTEQIDDEYFQQHIQPTLSNYCWKYINRGSYYEFYLKSYDSYIEFVANHLHKCPQDRMPDMKTTLLKYASLNLIKSIYQWYSRTCFTITMPKISRESVQSFLKSVELESIFIPSQCDDEADLCNKSYSSDACYEAAEVDENDSNQIPKNVAYVKLKNPKDSEKLIFLNGKKGVKVEASCLWNSAQDNSVPIINEFTINGIGPDVTLSDIRKWLGDVETNTIIRDGSLVRVFLCSDLQVDKLLERNFTTFDNNFITITQSTIKVNESLSGIVFHCFVKDISQDSLESLLDWTSGIDVRSYSISPDFENCFLLKISPSDLKNLLFRSGSKDYMGNEILIRYATKRYEKDIVFVNTAQRVPSDTTAATVDNNQEKPVDITSSNKNQGALSNDDLIL